MRLDKVMGCCLSIVVGSIVWWTMAPQTALALDVEPSDFEKKLIDHAPQGIDFGSYFDSETVAPINGNQNDALRLKNDVAHTTAVQLNRELPGRWSAFWSVGRTFNLRLTQKVSMWIYMSSRIKSIAPAEGMAFVLQNDPRTTADGTRSKAIAYSSTLTSENLGVWGQDTKLGSPEALAKTAIQNSWALEFDPYTNTGGSIGQADSFDNNVDGPHMASNYPGEPDTYKPQIVRPIVWFGTWYTSYELNHKGEISIPNIGDGQWHHVTMDYTAPDSRSSTEGHMVYRIDDQDRETGKSLPGKSSPKQTIDLTKFHTVKDGENKDKVFWGFTGTTQALIDDNTDLHKSRDENAMVVFEQVPGLVDSQSTATVSDDTQGAQVGENGFGTADHPVRSHDHLKLSFTATYNSGQAVWHDITAKATLPAGVTYPADAHGNVGTLTYDTGEQAAIPATAITGNELVVPLQHNLSQDSPGGATIELKGVVGNQSISIAPNKVEFVGANAVTNAAFPAFDIKGNQVSLTVDQAASTLAVNRSLGTEKAADAVIKGNVQSADPDNAERAMPIQVTLNGQPQTGITSTGGTDNRFTLSIPNDQLKDGLNTVALSVSDGENPSRTVAVSVKVGTVGFGDTTGDLNFQDTQLTGHQLEVPRAAKWSFEVEDDRVAGTEWTLAASATPLNSVDSLNQSLLNGTLIFKSNSGQITPLNETAVPIFTNVTKDSDPVIDITRDWHPDSGILLQVGSGALAGNYRGSIRWTLQDVATA